MSMDKVIGDVNEKVTTDPIEQKKLLMEKLPPKKKDYLKRVVVTQDLEGKWSSEIKWTDYPLLPRDVMRINRMLRVDQRLQFRKYHIERRRDDEVKAAKEAQDTTTVISKVEETGDVSV